MGFGKKQVEGEEGEGYVVRASSFKSKTGKPMFGLSIVSSKEELTAGEEGTRFTGFQSPKAQEGDFVTFQYKQNGEYFNLIDGSVVVDKTKSVVTSPKAGDSGRPAFNEAGQAWGNCTKQATDIILALMAAGKLPEKLTEIKGLEALVALQHETAVSLFTANRDVPLIVSAPASDPKEDE